jgi:biopolymer transport protein ExbD
MKLSSRNKIRPEFNMSSMTDLVFLLLIFFMLLSTLVTHTTVLDITLPKSSSDKKSIKSVRVSMDQELRYFVNEKEVAKEEILFALQRSIGDEKESKVEIALDESVPHKYFVELADIVTVQGKYNMVLVTKPPK